MKHASFIAELLRRHREGLKKLLHKSYKASYALGCLNFAVETTHGCLQYRCTHKQRTCTLHMHAVYLRVADIMWHVLQHGLVNGGEGGGLTPVKKELIARFWMWNGAGIYSQLYSTRLWSNAKRHDRVMTPFSNQSSFLPMLNKKGFLWTSVRLSIIKFQNSALAMKSPKSHNQSTYILLETFRPDRPFQSKLEYSASAMLKK